MPTESREVIMMALDPEMIERVKAQKDRRRASAVRYQDRPELAFIVQSFNRVSNIDQLIDGLRDLGDHELIVCEDGSLDGSRERWMSYLDRPNDFLIHSNDLHEIRILDRAIRFARAEILCLVQDDDLIPRDSAWLERALRQFRKNPRLAILGGFMGFESFDPDPARARRIWGGDDFRFVHHVNIGPYFIRRQCYEALGGWEYSFSDVGEPGICFDNELCLRAWVNDYQVGYSFVPFKGPSGHYAADGGTVLFSNDARVRNSVRNSDTIFQVYGPQAAQIDALVAAANATLDPPPAEATYWSTPVEVMAQAERRSGAASQESRGT
jgi:glycosyltransferase involved in cell wall biosynthesis